MPISMGLTGMPYTIQKISGRPEMSAFLRSMGFHEGVPVTMVIQRGSNMILRIHGLSVAVNEEQARNILVG